jgi:tetratricopeptide (TPR) repeat protein
MGFDKTKALNAAEKFLSQGKIPSAIQEYGKIVERDPADYSVLNTLGDLYARTKNATEAIDCFLRVADHYREQGFALKAIAMYKKVSRLNADVPGVAHNLARLYEQQGLYVEARAQYLLVADAAARAGQARDSLEALRRIADLDPKNVDIRARLAEGYTREGMSHDAAGAYVEAGELLLAAGRAQDALDAYKHAHKLLPSSHAVLHGLVAASSAVGAVAEAAQVLEQSVAETPGDLELLALLARTYIEAEDPPAAERATDALIKAEHTNYPLWFEVARLYLKREAVTDGVRVLTRAVEPALTGKQERGVLELLDDVLKLDPDQIDALKLVARIHTWHRDDEGMRVTLERLADAARRHDQPEEERRALEHLVRLVPFDQGYHERLSQLGGASEPPAAPDAVHADALQHFAHAATQTFTADAQNFAGDAATFGASSSFESTAFENLAEVNREATFGFISSAPLVAETASDPFAAPTNDPFAAPAFDFESNSVAQSAEPARTAAHADPSASFADLNAELSGEPAPAAPATFDFALERNGFDAPEPQIADPFAPGATDAVATGESDERVHAMLKQELESVDFYLEQGYTDIARDTLDMLERQYGASQETAARRARLHPGATADAHTHDAEESEFSIDEQSFVVDVEEPKADAHATAAPPATLEVIGSSAPPATGEVATSNESQTSRASQASPAPQAVRDANASVAPPESPAQARARESRAADQQLASIFGEFLDDATDEPPASHDEDFETHHNLGVAYKEMCLWDEAIEQFQKAIDLTAPADGTSRYLECCNMLGHCLTQKGMPRAAVIWLKKALAIPGLSEDESQALRYDLAAAYEQMGDIDRAIDTFSEVYGTDVSYRGVAERLRELQSMKPVNRES